MKQVTYDNLPESISEILAKVDQILSMTTPIEERDKLMNLEELREYLPEKPAKQTIYGWVTDKKIPYERHGKFLFFRKSHISEWLDNGRQINT